MMQRLGRSDNFNANFMVWKVGMAKAFKAHLHEKYRFQMVANITCQINIILFYSTYSFRNYSLMHMLYILLFTFSQRHFDKW